MLLAQVTETVAQVGATFKRGDKTVLLAALLRKAAPDDIVPLIGFLTGHLRQGAIGSGWAAVTAIDSEPALEPSITVTELDAAISALQATTGPGSQADRSGQLHRLFAKATAGEQEHLGRLIVGELRQGALAGLATDAVAKAAGTPAALTRRAAMLSGDLGLTARSALFGGSDALSAIGLRVGRGVQPMLGSTAELVADAVEALGESSVEWKLDGIRIQVHKSGSGVRVLTRNLNNVTSRVPDIVNIVQALEPNTLVLDGEVIGGGGEDAARLAPWFFDVLHVGGEDLIDETLRWQTERFTELAVAPDTLHEHHVVEVHPVQVVEIAIDGVQRSTRYRGGVALRFARVKGYRSDRPASEADLISSLQALL
jgi:DNA ligase 1